MKVAVKKQVLQPSFVSRLGWAEGETRKSDQRKAEEKELVDQISRFVRFVWLDDDDNDHDHGGAGAGLVLVVTMVMTVVAWSRRFLGDFAKLIRDYITEERAHAAKLEVVNLALTVLPLTFTTMAESQRAFVCFSKEQEKAREERRKRRKVRRDVKRKVSGISFQL